MTAPTFHTARRVIRAPADAIWALLSDPAQHHRFDDTNMVGEPVTHGILTRVGQMFTMNMTYRDGSEVEHYQSDNYVVVLEPLRAIAWATATRGGPKLGWTWTYTLHAEPEGTTTTLTYDWAGTSQDDIAKFGVPLTDKAGLGRSLDLLATAAETH